MNKKGFFLLLILLIFSNCSFDTKSGIWTEKEKISKEKDNQLIKKLFEIKDVNYREFNTDLKINTPLRISIDKDNYLKNNLGPQFVKENLKNKSKYKFSKIEDFEYFSPELIFIDNDIIFFDNKGSILRFGDDSKIVWKKNYYSKSEKKLFSILNFTLNNEVLIVSDNLSKYYALDVRTGELLWTKDHNTLFISELKIDGDKFYAVDSDNTLNCFSIKNGDVLWKFRTENKLIKTQKKLSIVIDLNSVYFNNSKGDIYSLNKISGNLNWIYLGESQLSSAKTFFVKTSQLVIDEQNLYFSDVNGSFYSLEKRSGFLKWKQDLKTLFLPIISDNLIFLVSDDGYFFIIESESGNILRVNNLLKYQKKNNKLKIFGFALSDKKIYLSLNSRKMIEANISDPSQISSIKVGGGRLSKPIINKGNLYLIKDDEIIKFH